jgi:hypothetical protein
LSFEPRLKVNCGQAGIVILIHDADGDLKGCVNPPIVVFSLDHVLTGSIAGADHRVQSVALIDVVLNDVLSIGKGMV